MSKTYRKSGGGSQCSDSGYHYKTPRYKAGSRGKTHQIVARGVKHSQPDMQRFGQAIVRSALLAAQLEIEAKQHDEVSHD